MKRPSVTATLALAGCLLFSSGCASLIIEPSDSAGAKIGKFTSRFLLVFPTFGFSEIGVALAKEEQWRTGTKSKAQIRADNRQNLNSLTAGISKQEVLVLMGTNTIHAEYGSVITNPYRTEMYRTDDGVFELLLYYTDKKSADGAITDDELTPIVLKDGRVDGWGWSYWNNVIQKYEIRMR